MLAGLLANFPISPHRPGREGLVIGTSWLLWPFCGVVRSNLAFGIARTAILLGLPVDAVQVIDMSPWPAGALYAQYIVLITIGQTIMVRRLERCRPTRALMVAAPLGSGPWHSC